MPQYHQQSYQGFQRISYVLFALVALFIALTFTQHGLSNDEPVQHQYGRLLLDFYASGFTNQAAFHYVNLYLYGGLFDIFAALLEKWLPFFDVWDIRHFLSALFGLLGLVAVYKTTEKIQHARAGFFAVLLLSLTGAWTGAMFMHTKDIPFATCMAWALYYSVLLSEKVAQNSLTSIPKNLVFKLGAAIGCALGIRIGGGFAVMYLLLMLCVASFFQLHQIQGQAVFWRQVFAKLWWSAFVAFVLMAIFWPWGVMSPSHPFEAVRAFSHFSFNMTTIVDGQVVSVGDAPRTYLLQYLAVRLPESFLLGLLSFFVYCVFFARKKITLNDLPMLTVLIAIIFPLSFVLLTQPALYNGVRHFTFVIPPLAIVAGIGLDKMLDHIKNMTQIKWIFVAGLIALCGLNMFKLIQFHPYEYVAYNRFAGDTATLNNRWEADYWSSGLLDAARQLNQMTLPKKSTPYLVAICADDLQGGSVLAPHFLVSKNWIDADFFMSSTQMHCDQVLKGKMIGEVKRQGLLLTVIKDRRLLTGQDRMPVPAPM